MQVSYQRLHNMNPIQARRMIIETYPRCASISATAHQMGTSRQVVRKWIRRYEAEGEKGLMDRSRRPHISPRKTPYHPKRLLCNRLGTPIFSPKEKRREKEFGGKSQRTLERLQETLYSPWNAVLARIPLGRKGYNGRVERSHLTDDEEFYLPCILSWNNADDMLRSAQAWQYIYNVKRPHFGKGMGSLSPLDKLRSLGYNQLNDNFILFPVLLLDDLNPLLPGNDVLTMDSVSTLPLRLTGYLPNFTPLASLLMPPPRAGRRSRR
ncbi:hypothetical protein CEE36_08505 [candidate division TA06 bacterium B3_TA06]|uniref:Insertion element IS150 protein InsJ-like helix-turn-helix domain-containing protein n=1 Tax=candidate division TA06 bacterium B3_TA06 TaxID=2012487 RepID=A0A532V2A7_UNCT6|nr:MAG: hypothetical protein CEE36_08505 [candidate division TA06 bacterium B3_TA06]